MTKGNIEQTINALRQMTVTQLREQYEQVFGEPSRSGNKDFLFKRVAWRVQSLVEGGLSERAKRRAEELARDADVRTTLPRPTAASPGSRTTTSPAKNLGAHDRMPIPGTVLTRTYRGKRIAVKVLPNGFDYEGQPYRSLSAIAKAVTGSHWNGHLFFGLTKHKRGNPDA